MLLSPYLLSFSYITHLKYYWRLWTESTVFLVKTKKLLSLSFFFGHVYLQKWLFVNLSMSYFISRIAASYFAKNYNTYWLVFLLFCGPLQHLSSVVGFRSGLHRSRGWDVVKIEDVGIILGSLKLCWNITYLSCVCLLPFCL